MSNGKENADNKLLDRANEWSLSVSFLAAEAPSRTRPAASEQREDSANQKREGDEQDDGNLWAGPAKITEEKSRYKTEGIFSSGVCCRVVSLERLSLFAVCK